MTTFSTTKKLKVLKFDAFYPNSYFEKLKAIDEKKIASMNYEEYYDWMISQRMYLSDYFTYHMRQEGWQAKEFIAHDTLLMKKLIRNGEIKKIGIWYRFLFLIKFVFSVPIKDLFRPPILKPIWRKELKQWLIDKYIESYNPDVLFIREPSQIDGRFFDKYKKSKLIVTLIGCNTSHAHRWYAHRNDLIFTIFPSYYDFFLSQNIKSQLVEYGVDERISREIVSPSKIYDCTFVGLLGDPVQSEKTLLMESIANSDINFKWWGVKGININKYPALVNTWHGETSGKEMLEIYKSSKIVINDFVDTAREESKTNIRLKEVMSVGSFILSRNSKNLTALENSGALRTFNSTDDCIAKIKHYLANEQEREKIADTGLKYAVEHFNYRDIVRNMMTTISQSYERKFSSI
jgi:hypothetical protein